MKCMQIHKINVWLFESKFFRHGSNLSSRLHVDRGVARLEERELVVEADLWRREEAHLNRHKG